MGARRGGGGGEAGKRPRGYLGKTKIKNIEIMTNINTYQKVEEF
jgi:hypothetical protein